MEDHSLNDKVFVVTGGTQGLGEGIARRLASLRAGGIVICGRSAQRGRAVAKALELLGAQALYVKADLAREADCRGVIRACDKRFGVLHGLINAAGNTDRGTIEDTSAALWDRIFAVNARAPFILMQEAVRVMKREKVAGSIVNIMSISSHGGQPFLTAYSASKGALAVLTKNAAHALRGDRIRVNGLNIGWMDTPNEHRVQRAMGQPADWLKRTEARLPFKRLLRPPDVAKLTTYLLSSDSEMMTGSLIDFDQNVVGAHD